MSVAAFDLEALLATALAHVKESEGDVYRGALRELRLHGGAAALERARILATSPDAREREVAADLLGRLGVEADPRPFASEAIPILRSLLEDDSPTVLSSALYALSDTPDPQSLARIVSFARHPESHIRLAVTRSLIAYLEDPAAVTALIDLSRDASSEVRDWATFALGSQNDADSPAIREALLARLNDPDENPRNEAVVGLGRRRDARVIPAIVRVLDDDTEGGTILGEILEIAAELADPGLLPALEQYRATCDDRFRAQLELAITACTPSG